MIIAITSRPFREVWEVWEVTLKIQIKQQLPTSRGMPPYREILKNLS